MKNTRSIIAASAVALALMPFFAGAQSVSELQAQIQNLLAQIAALQQQLGARTLIATTSVTNTPPAGPASGTGSASAPPSNIICPVFNYTLSRGSRGDAITALQKFLVGQGFLTADSMTGFYGALTEAAVQNFQTKQGIVSSGTPATTGWGVVGKSTSAAIVRVCSSAFTSQPAPVTPANPAACTAIALVCPAGKHDQIGPNCSHTCMSSPTVSSCLPLPLPTSSCAPCWKPDTDINGCTISYTCTTGTIGTSPASCPSYALPNCGSGFSAQWQGNDSRGCSLGYQCVGTTPVSSCPMYQQPFCPSNQHVVSGTYNSATGCYATPYCIAN
jgi:peptidoglycan hydrolase-like protein with peptidoglycan-binding domain